MVTHAAEHGAHLSMRTVATPLGAMVMMATARGLCLLEFVDRPALARERRNLERLFGPAAEAESPWLAQAAVELDEYFAGARREFKVPLDLPGSDFQRGVWAALREIPLGQTRSYGEMARRAGRPGAVRAMARANGDNRVSIVVPCHRVIGADGSLTGYGGGLERKRWLLEHEGAMTRGLFAGM